MPNIRTSTAAKVAASCVLPTKSTLWRRIQARTFPEPVKLSERVTVWRAEDIRRWISQQGQRG